MCQGGPVQDAWSDETSTPAAKRGACRSANSRADTGGEEAGLLAGEVGGDDRTRFTSAMEVQSFVGTAPKTVQSGTWRGVCFRFSCNRFYRTLMQQMALSALVSSAWAKSYYKGKRAEGKTHQHALRCLANLLLKVAHAMWRDRTEYSEDRHLAQIMRHQMTVPARSA